MPPAMRASTVSTDVPSLDFRDPEAVRRQAEHARSLGFTGKGVIHPSNVAIVNDVFSPGQDEIARARLVVQAYLDSPTGLRWLTASLSKNR